MWTKFPMEAASANNLLSREQAAAMIAAMPPGRERDQAANLALQVYGPAPPTKKFLPYQFRPKDYLETFLNWSPWKGQGKDMPGQVEILEAYTLALRQQFEKRDFEAGRLKEKDLKVWKPGTIIQNYIRMEAGHNTGKCVIITDMITLADGKRVKAEELINTQFRLPTLDTDGRIVSTAALAADNGVKPVYELTTETGKKLRRTDNHPLWSSTALFRTGYRPQIPQGDWKPITDIEKGDVVAVPDELAVFGNNDLPDHEIKLIAYLIGDGGLSARTVRFTKPEGKQVDEFIKCADLAGCRTDRLGEIDYIVYGKRKSVTGPGTGRLVNPLVELMKQHGLMGKLSGDKFVPPAIFELSREKLQIFLSRLFGTDGWASVSKSGNTQIGYGSKSKQLIEDLQHLLIRFGVHARTRYRETVDSWVLEVNDACDILTFIENIGIYGKEPAVDKLATRVRPTVERKLKQIALRPNRPRWIHKNAFPGTRWERVVSVEYIGEERTVAIEVPEFHTYLTEFYEHNTKIAEGIICHFFDCFAPSVCMMYAPTWDALKDNLWQEIKGDRQDKNLTGRLLETIEIYAGPKHFIKGRAVSNSKGIGTEKVQGIHNEFQLFVIDEAEGVDDFLFDAIDSMTSGGISIVLMMANPKTRTSKFHRIRENGNVRSFRMSCINHPNVVAGREIVPNAVQREYVRSMIETHCEVVTAHNEDNYTFTVPFDIATKRRTLKAGTIFQPDNEFMWRVLGIAPANISDMTVIPVGRYDAAKKRTEVEFDETDVERATFGIDVARSGVDYGTLYVRWKNMLWRARQFYHEDSKQYFHPVLQMAQTLVKQGVRSLHVRIDAGGGAGLIDTIKHSLEFRELFIFEDAHGQLVINEVHFGGNPGNEKNRKKYDDLVTEMYFETAETLRGVRVVNPPETLETELTTRQWEPVNRSGKELKKLISKKVFKKQIRRSPDDADGFVLCAAPDSCFSSGKLPAPSSVGKVSLWTVK